MNNAIPRERKENRTIVHSNPVLSCLSKVSERTETNQAAYGGIATKTLYFLLITLVGVVAQLLVKAALAGEPVWQTIKIYEKFTLSLSQKEAVITGAVLVVGLICELLGIQRDMSGAPRSAWCLPSSGFI